MEQRPPDEHAEQTFPEVDPEPPAPCTDHPLHRGDPMSAPVATTDRPAQTRPALDLPRPGCDACDHPAAAHDSIGLRYCRATLDSTLSRGCVCRSA